MWLKARFVPRRDSARLGLARALVKFIRACKQARTLRTVAIYRDVSFHRTNRSNSAKIPR